MENLELTFTHPRESDRRFVAELSNDCTGAKAVTGLTEERFLEPAPANRPYELVVARSNVLVPPNATFGSMGVQTGDVIDVRQRGQGAA
jgi:hypothetical protein